MNGRNPGGKRRRIDTSRVPGGFVALPWDVLDSLAYQGLSYPARALLLELSRQFVKDNNGRLLATLDYLRQRGWTSQDVITRAMRELVDARLVHQTVKGGFPRRASWFALTWFSLDKHADYDAGVAATFERGAYRKNEALKPPDGAMSPSIEPPSGARGKAVAPPDGSVEPILPPSLAPPDGRLLDITISRRGSSKRQGHESQSPRQAAAPEIPPGSIVARHFVEVAPCA